jgi:hypothetical protein
VTCYFWHEAEGDLTANTFASCITDYVENLDERIEEVIMYSDGCTYQNRNAVLANALLNVSHEKNIRIVQKILEKGHTQMEVDNVHSVIEKKLRNKPIYSPQNYVDIMKACRPSQPYAVKYLTHDFFKDFTVLNYYQSIRPGSKAGEPTVTDLKVLKYFPDGTIYYKLHHDGDEFMDFPRRARLRAPTTDDFVRNLYQQRIAIKSVKYAHLQELESVIPGDYHPFYDSLPHT